MNLKELPNRLEELQRNAVRKVRRCTYKNCGKPTVKNHCVSQSMLCNITDGRHVRELTVNPWVPGMLVYNRKGIGEASVFQELCNYHDHILFEPIDKPEIELNYTNLVLMTYRSLLRERHKKLAKTESYGTFSGEFRQVRSQIVYETHNKYFQFQFNFKSIEWYEKALIAEIDNPRGNFVFKTLEYPYFPVAGSELFTYEPADVTHLKRNLFNRTNVLEPFSDVFLNLIPSKAENKLKVSIGVHKKDEFLLRVLYRHLKKKNNFKALSDILFLHVEDWVCAEEFYDKFLKGREPDIVKLFAASSGCSIIERTTRFNLFRSGR